jgi:hypothetical protein
MLQQAIENAKLKQHIIDNKRKIYISQIKKKYMHKNTCIKKNQKNTNKQNDLKSNRVIIWL